MTLPFCIRHGETGDVCLNLLPGLFTAMFWGGESKLRQKNNLNDPRCISLSYGQMGLQIHLGREKVFQLLILLSNSLPTSQYCNYTFNEIIVLFVALIILVLVCLIYLLLQLKSCTINQFILQEYPWTIIKTWTTYIHVKSSNYTGIDSMHLISNTREIY